MRQRPKFADGLYWGFAGGVTTTLLLDGVHPQILLLYAGVVLGLLAMGIVVGLVQRAKRRNRAPYHPESGMLFELPPMRRRRWW